MTGSTRTSTFNSTPPPAAQCDEFVNERHERFPRGKISGAGIEGAGGEQSTTIAVVARGKESVAI